MVKKIAKFENVKRTTKAIEEIVALTQCNYIDAIISYCEKTGLEVEHVADLVAKNANLKAKVEEDAESLNFLKRTSRLPIE